MYLFSYFKTADEALYLAVWEDVTARMVFPPGLRHGSVVPLRWPLGQE
ncbi:hypothetical protein [Paenibacillus sp. y28]